MGGQVELGASYAFSSENVGLLEVAQASALSKARLQRTSVKIHDFYRQYSESGPHRPCPPHPRPAQLPVTFDSKRARLHRERPCGLGILCKAIARPGYPVRISRL